MSLASGIGFANTCLLDWGADVMANLMKIDFSLGQDKFDNTPKQLAVETFDDFKSAVLSNRSSRKGEIYFCCSFEYGPHQSPIPNLNLITQH
jgi:hypothetical protein